MSLEEQVTPLMEDILMWCGRDWQNPWNLSRVLGCNLDPGHQGPHGFTEENPPYAYTGGVGEYNEGICGKHLDETTVKAALYDLTRLGMIQHFNWGKEADTIGLTERGTLVRNRIRNRPLQQ